MSTLKPGTSVPELFNSPQRLPHVNVKRNRIKSVSVSKGLTEAVVRFTRANGQTKYFHPPTKTSCKRLSRWLKASGLTGYTDLQPDFLVTWYFVQEVTQ